MRKLALIALLLAPATAGAQSTGTPVFAAPYRAFRASEIGLSISDMNGGTGFEGFYKYGHQKWDIGFRGGFIDLDGGSNPLLLGADGRTRLVTHDQSFPLDGSLTVGAGAMLQDNFNVFQIPVGFSMGRRLDLEGSSVSFVPYFQPVATLVFGDADSDLLFSIGLGADIRLNPQFDLRVAGAVGDMDGVSISLAWLR